MPTLHHTNLAQSLITYAYISTPTFPLQLILPNRRLLTTLTDSRSPNLHPINTLLLLKNLPYLVRLTTSQHNSCTPIGPIPTVLTILMLHSPPLSTSQTLAISSNFFINHDLLQPNIFAHIRVSATLLGLLVRLIKEAQLIGVLSAVSLDTLALESAEDIIWAEVCCEVVLAVFE